MIFFQLLTKTCEHPGSKGHSPVSDAMSTMRLRFGEPVRFRFLVGMLSGACPDLLAAGLRFINAFVETAHSDQLRFYIQAELEQAGFKPSVLAKVSILLQIIQKSPDNGNFKRSCKQFTNYFSFYMVYL